MDKLTGSFSYGIPNNGVGGGKPGDTIIEGNVAVEWGLNTTENVVAEVGTGYLCATVQVSEIFYVNLPTQANSVDGAIIGIGDGEGNASVNNIVIQNGGTNLEGGDNNITIDTDKRVIQLTYVAANNDWVVVTDTLDTTGGGSSTNYVELDAILYDQGGFSLINMTPSNGDVYFIHNISQDLELEVTPTNLSNGDTWEFWHESTNGDSIFFDNITADWYQGQFPWDFSSGSKHKYMCSHIGGTVVIHYMGWFDTGQQPS